MLNQKSTIAVLLSTLSLTDAIRMSQMNKGITDDLTNAASDLVDKGTKVAGDVVDKGKDAVGDLVDKQN